MSDTANIIDVYFDGLRVRTVMPTWQMGYGRKLRFADIELPHTAEVHMCNVGDSEADRAIATDGVVELYDKYFETGKDVEVYVFLHPEEGSGVTMYKVNIPIMRRPAIKSADPTPEQRDIIEQAIEALENANVERTTYTDDGEGNITISTEVVPVG